MPKFKTFINKYPPNYFINKVQSIIDKMITSITNSGSGFGRFLLIIPLAICIIILQGLIIIKFFIKNIFEVIKFILKFIRKLVITLLEELEFYWKKVKDTSHDLVNNLKVINTKLLAIIRYQLDKLKYDHATIQDEYHYLKLPKIIAYTTISFIYLLLWAMFSIIISIILVVSTLTILGPFLHQWVRINVFKSV